ncbi:MAG: hypothetical protein JJU37_12880 [Balneolaceae bacterium]|nr:hypothetical protein [Balneolaceae bacterium]
MNRKFLQINYWILLCLLMAGCSSGSTAPQEEEETYEFYYRVIITDAYGIDPEIEEPGRAQVTWRDGNDQFQDNFDNPVIGIWESPKYIGFSGLRVSMTVTELTRYKKTILAQIVVENDVAIEEEKLMEESRTQGISVEHVLGQINH